MRVRLPCSEVQTLPYTAITAALNELTATKSVGEVSLTKQYQVILGSAKSLNTSGGRVTPQPNLTAPYIQTDRRFYGRSSRLNLLLYSTICRAKSAHAQLRMHWRVEQGCSLDVFVLLRVMFPNHSQHTCLGWGCWFLLEMWRRFFPYNTECNCGGTINL